MIKRSKDSGRTDDAIEIISKRQDVYWKQTAPIIKYYRENKILKETCLSDVKKYLRKHNLIKMVSSAPEDVLRNMYEDSYLSGKVFNKNPENLLHNYLNDEDNFS